ncbi:MAG: transcription termination factor NusA, partial [Cetobacterium sp.]
VWKEDIKEFVSAVLSPAKVISVEVLEEGVTARVLVENSQLSLAIGKNGQNARLAAKLTGMRVDNKTVDSFMAENSEIILDVNEEENA